MLWTGCATFRPYTEQLSWQMNAPTRKNPMFVPIQDHERLWATIYDVVDGHFDIAKSDPVRLYDGVLTEGRLTTKPKIAPSVMEPWLYGNTGSIAECRDSTFQTIQHRAVVRVVPETSGFLIELQVFKELEARTSPIGAQATTANLRSDGASNEIAYKIDHVPGSIGWTTFDRDTQLEEKLLGEIDYRLQHPSCVVRESREPIRGQSK